MHAALRESSCLIAYPAERAKKSKAQDWKAVRADACWIGDHPRFVKLFKPLLAPEEARARACSRIGIVCADRARACACPCVRARARV